MCIQDGTGKQNVQLPHCQLHWHKKAKCKVAMHELCDLLMHVSVPRSVAVQRSVLSQMSICNDLKPEHSAVDHWHMLKIEQNVAVFV